MARVLIVCGDTGSGKSTSLKNLNPKETYIVNTLNKPLPFKGSKGLYNTESRNIKETDSYSDLLTIMKGINDQATHIKNLILDDIGFIMTTELFARAKETGYGKFTDIALHMQQIISYAKSMREDLNVVFMFHDDDDISDRVKIGKKLKTVGKMVEDQYNPLGVVTVALFTNVSFDDKSGEAKYNFVTNRVQKNGIIIPAKSPADMFDSLYIPNDLSIVFKAMDEYYK